MLSEVERLVRKLISKEYDTYLLKMGMTGLASFAKAMDGIAARRRNIVWNVPPGISLDRNHYVSHTRFLSNRLK